MKSDKNFLYNYYQTYIKLDKEIHVFSSYGYNQKAKYNYRCSSSKQNGPQLIPTLYNNFLL